MATTLGLLFTAIFTGSTNSTAASPTTGLGDPGDGHLSVHTTRVGLEGIITARDSSGIAGKFERSRLVAGHTPVIIDAAFRVRVFGKGITTTSTHLDALYLYSREIKRQRVEIWRNTSGSSIISHTGDNSHLGNGSALHNCKEIDNHRHK